MNLDETISKVVERLERNRNFPKYQFERSIDVFLSLFIEEYLNVHCNADVQYVAAEFPLKKEANNRSTNVDYIYFKRGVTPSWMFVELKTDASSVREGQLALYNDLVARNAEMKLLLDNIENYILPKSKQKRKYKYLLDIIRHDVTPEEICAPISVVYITGPFITEDLKKKYTYIEWIDLSNFADQLTHTQYPELWHHVKKLLSFAPTS